jgi:hypothetical protein
VRCELPFYYCCILTQSLIIRYLYDNTVLIEVNTIFGNEQPQQDPTQVEDVSLLVKDLMRRVRVLEERYSSIRKNIQVNEQNVLATNKKMKTEVETVNLDLSDLKQSIREMNENIVLIVKELRETVKKEEVKVLEKYIELWEPLNFVSHDEMERYVDAAVGSRKSKK